MMRGCLLLLLAATLSAQLSQLPRDPAKPGTASIEGTAINQLTREPIRKAAVHLWGTGQPMIAVTDATGRFIFRALPAGAYSLRAEAPGFQSPEMESGPPPAIAIAAGEHKQGAEVTLIPEATIGGRVRDEYGDPVTDCQVAAARFEFMQGDRRLAVRSIARTNDRGEYHLRHVQPGRYYAFASCETRLPAPHPLMRQDDPRRPEQRYARQFYPGVPDVAGATRVAVAPGVALSGIDFNLRRVPAFTVRGQIAGLDPAPGEGVQIRLRPNAAVPEFAGYFGVADPAGRFQVQGVPGGVYRLVAIAYRNGGPGARGAATLPVQVGDGPPDPIEVLLTPARDVTGTVEIERDNDTPPPPPNQKTEIVLSHVGANDMPMPDPPPATVQDDGTFTLSGVLPGRRRLSLNAPGYIKSFTIGERTVSPYAFEIDADAGPWRIVIGTKYGQVAAAIQDALPPGHGASSVLLVPDNPRFFGAGLEMSSSPNENGVATLMGIRPGRYRVYALETGAAWNLLQRPEVLRAFERRSATVELEEGGQAQVTLSLIRADELKRALDEQP